MSEERQWLILSYRVPAEPSTVRVRVWRTLKSIGAFYIQQSVCVLPLTLDTKKTIAQLQGLITENHGEALLLEVKQFSNLTEEQMISSFNQQREAEYKEFLEGCTAFQQEIERETELQKFTFHEVEENEAELIRLRRWYRKIFKRDYFRSECSTESAKELDKCEMSLRRFTESVYQAEGNREGELM